MRRRMHLKVKKNPKLEKYINHEQFQDLLCAKQIKLEDGDGHKNLVFLDRDLELSRNAIEPLPFGFIQLGKVGNLLMESCGLEGPEQKQMDQMGDDLKLFKKQSAQINECGYRNEEVNKDYIYLDMECELISLKGAIFGKIVYQGNTMFFQSSDKQTPTSRKYRYGAMREYCL